MTKIKKVLPTLGSQTTLIDTHCHLDMDRYEGDLKEILKRSYDHGIEAIVTIGIDLHSSTKAIDLAKSTPMIYATAGIHPHDVGNISTETLNKVSSLIEQERANIVGYGEIGLDYVKQYSKIETQKKHFSNQLSIAKNFHLPVIIHDREAHDDTFQILKSMGPFDGGGIMHCFSGDIEYAKKILDLGFYISIPGIVTFKNAQDLKEVAQNIPLNSLILETDGPFLAPVPYRGKRNEPLYLLYTAQEVSLLRDISLDETARATTRNAKDIFHI